MYLLKSDSDFMRSPCFIFLTAILSLLFFSCQEENNKDDLPLSEKSSLTVIFSTNGIGDMTYNDSLFHGVMDFAFRHDDVLDVYQVQPTAQEQGVRVLTEWLASVQADTHRVSKARHLLVLASSEWEQILSELVFPLPENYQVILLESTRQDWPAGVSVMNVSLYGPCYLAGYLAAWAGKKRPMIIAACPDEPKLQEGIDGFTDGYFAYGRSAYGFAADTAKIDIRYLAQDHSGFNMSDEAFLLSYELLQGRKMDCILPLCGGSALGIYRYFNSRVVTLLIGMDGDCSQLCNAVGFSVTRHVGLLINRWLDTWFSGRELPLYQNYTLEQGFSSIKINPYYYRKLDWAAQIDSIWPVVLEKEKQYVER